MTVAVGAGLVTSRETSTDWRLGRGVVKASKNLEKLHKKMEGRLHIEAMEDEGGKCSLCDNNIWLCLLGYIWLVGEGCLGPPPLL
jgi:hypothetical protein